MFEFELPDLGEGVAEGEVLEWHVAPGDRVAEDDLLAEVETDKAVVDVPSPVDGTVRELHAQAGEEIPVGTVIVTIDTDEDAAGDESSEEGESEAADGAESSGDSESGTSAKGGRVFAPPSVRRLARDLDVDITTVAGSGPGGRITEGDVRAAAERADESGDDESGPTAVVSKAGDSEDGEGEDSDGPKRAVTRVGGEDEQDSSEDGKAVKSAVRKADSGGARRDQTLATPATRKVARELDVDIDAVPTDEKRDGQPYVSEAAVREYARQRDESAADRETSETVVADTAAGEERREPYRGIRRTIGEQMARSRREVPHATHHDRVEVSELVAARERLKPLAEKRDVRLTYTPFVLKSVAAALREHPVLNTELDEESEEIVYKHYYHIGVATATDHGLVVPVVRNVDEKGIIELAREVNDLVSRARERELAREEMQGGTFTVTNFGAIGGEYADPVINVPETAILGIGALRDRPVAADGEVVARPTLPLSLAIDHRVIDGADAARFVNTLKEYLADPTRLLLE
ncbi:MAG: dihydrolipoamide acetyltransferase family protein [Haloarculaceae archaeon]